MEDAPHGLRMVSSSVQPQSDWQQRLDLLPSIDEWTILVESSDLLLHLSDVMACENHRRSGLHFLALELKSSLFILSLLLPQLSLLPCQSLRLSLDG